MTAQFVVLLSLVAIASAGVVGHHGGTSVGSRKQDDFGNYAFNYQIKDGLGATNGRWEAGNGHGGVVGSYNLADIDGRARTVSYVADKAGFRAKVKTNEPGTAHSLPAAAVYDSPYAGPVVHGPTGHGPIVVKAAFVAPVVAGYGGYGHGGYGHGGYGHGGYGHGGYGHGGYGHGGYGHGLGYGGHGYGHGGYGKGFGYHG